MQPPAPIGSERWLELHPRFFKVFMMRMKAITSSVMAFGLMASASAMAAGTGTVHFEGEITSSTCEVVTSDQNKTVTLPTVSTNTLSADNDTAGLTPFTISLENCSVETDQGVSAYFEPGANVDLNTGRLLNASGDATNVQIGLLSGSQEEITIGAIGSNDLQDGAEWYNVEGNAATMNYFAQYHATGGAATAGSVSTSVDFTVTYK